MTFSSPQHAPGNPRPALAPILKQGPARAAGADLPVRGSLWPFVVLAVIALVAASIADATAEAWPLGVLMLVPVAAVAWDRIGRLSRPPAPLRKRPSRVVRDRRPALLRAVIKVPPGRPGKIVRRRPPPDFSTLRTAKSVPRPPNRAARLVLRPDLT